MGRKIADPTQAGANQLFALGDGLRLKRKALGLNATEVAEAAGISRVTLHRIEKGEPGVTAGAYIAVGCALGVTIGIEKIEQTSELPESIPIEQYPQLRKLGWQLKPGAELTPEEAWGLYVRNWRHLNHDELDENESALITNLRKVMERTNV